MSIRRITKEMLAHIYAARDFAPGEPSRAVSIEYDVCVIGSGPGGAVAAATLAQAGLRVVLIERGPFFPPEDSSFRVLDMSNRMGHLELTTGYRTLLYQGNGLGGGSLLFGAVAMQPPDYIFEEWRDRSGVEALSVDSLGRHYSHVAEIMSVTRQSRDQENESNAIVRRMADVLGKSEGLDLVHRYTKGCAGAGMCNFGCGFNLKGNMTNSFIPLGLETGNLTVLTECEARGIAGSRRNGTFQATGVNVRFRDFASGRNVHDATIKAKHVITAAGAFFSSVLLLGNREIPSRDRIGARVYLQPHAQIFALFDHAITKRGELQDGQYVPYNGVPAIYNFTGFLREHRFFWLASILFPANLSSFISSLPPAEHFAIMRRFHQTMSITLTLRDDPEKSRIVFRDGRAQLDFHESGQDLENLRQCFILAARGMLAVGARRVFLPLLKPPRIEREADLKQVERLNFGYDGVLLYSDHTSGGNPLGISEQHGVTDAFGRVHGTTNVYIADSSVFPTAAGINPSWTIMALARRSALNLAANAGKRMG